MLGRFRTPRWQHPDDDVRAEAVRSLHWDEDADALTSVIRGDASARVRALALERCVSIELILERLQHDESATVREAARGLRRMRLAALVEGDPAADTAVLDQPGDPGLADHLVREAAHRGLREAALARIERDSVLRDVALSDPDPALRLSALDRISDERVIERVYERSRRQDKTISRRARERLDTLIEERERPRRVEAACAQICVSLEHLGREDRWEADERLCEQLEARWAELEPALRASSEARYASALTAFKAALRRHQDVELPAVRAREALLARIEAWSDTPASTDPPASDPGEQLARLQQEFDGADPLPQALLAPLAARFDAAMATARAALALREHDAERLRLVAEHDRLLGGAGPIPEAEAKRLHRAAEQLDGRTGEGTAAKRLGRARERLRARIREQTAWKDETLSGLGARIDALREALASAPGTEAVTAHDGVVTDLDALASAGASEERLKPLRARLRPLSKEIEVVRSWRRFGAQRGREALCEEMEALAGSEASPESIAEKVRAARAAWKNLDSGGGRVDRALWERFDTAASAAYERYQSHRQSQAREREQNLDTRRSLLEELDTYLTGVRGGPDMDWKAAVRLRRSILDRWRAAHPVPRKHVRGLRERFDSRFTDLEDLLARERERCRTRREALITRAEALTTAGDARAAAEDCKALQREWAVTVPGHRREEQALWERFRAACDAVFADRAETTKRERAQRESGLGVRRGICERLEALARDTTLDDADVDGEERRLRAEWDAAGEAPHRSARDLERRYRAARSALRRRREDLARAARDQALGALLRRAALCAEAEALESIDAERVTALRARWSELPPVQDEDIEHVAERFEAALSAGGTATDQRARNQAERESLCLRLEILAGVESPPEHARARMAYQVDRLAGAFGKDSGAPADDRAGLIRAWCITGAAPPGVSTALEARFQRALAGPGGDGTT